MDAVADHPDPSRQRLSRDGILRTAVAIADEGGIEAVTMRRVAASLGVEAMSLYHHVAGKDALLDGMVDLVFAEIDEPPAEGTDWRAAMRARATSAREALRRHPWATPLMDSRTAPGPATLRHHEAVLGCLRTAGFDLPTTAHAVALLDSYLYGFALQEAALPFEGGGQELHDVAGAILADLPAEEFPHLAEMVTGHALRPGYDFGAEFSWGLDLLLDALERRRTGPRRTSGDR